MTSAENLRADVSKNGSASGVEGDPVRRLSVSVALILFLLGCADVSRFQAAAPSRGTVVDESGNPVAGVRYGSSGFEERTADGWRVMHFSGLAEMRFTGSDGRFEVPQREGLRSDVDFDKSGFVPVFVRGLESDREIQVTLRRGLDVRGSVRQRTPSGESAAEGVRVVLRRPNPRGLWFETEAFTDARGEFAFPGFLPGSQSQGAEGPGWQLVCSGAVLDLPAHVDRPIDDLRVEVALGRGP